MDEQPSNPVGAMAPDVREIIRPLSKHFAGKSVSPQAVLWPNAEDLPERFHALLNGVDWSQYSADRQLRLLDLGCGPGFLLDYLSHAGLIDKVDYVGVDLSPEILSAAKARWPEEHFSLRDIRDEPFPPSTFDYAILCGVFTVRFALGQSAMRALMVETLEAVWQCTEHTIAYNVMSKHVDWERDDLFHLSCDDAIAIARDRLGTREVRILHDYGLFEYACLVSREPRREALSVPAGWFEH